MGATIKISCKSCGAKWQCQTGCGFLHGDLDQIAILYPENIQWEIKNCIGETTFPWFEFNYRLSYCKQCNSIVSVPQLKLGDAHTEFTGKCSKCGQETQLIENMEESDCPVCHKKSLLTEVVGMWD